MNNNSFISENKIKEFSALTLAFVGDAVYELMVREHLVSCAEHRIGQQNTIKVELVRCEFQAKAARAMLTGFLTEDEVAIYKRGRNSAPGTVPKNASAADYNAATGLEALFGFLHLSGQNERKSEIINYVLGVYYGEKNTKSKKGASSS